MTLAALYRRLLRAARRVDRAPLARYAAFNLARPAVDEVRMAAISDPICRLWERAFFADGRFFQLTPHAADTLRRHARETGDAKARQMLPKPDGADGEDAAALYPSVEMLVKAERREIQADVAKALGIERIPWHLKEACMDAMGERRKHEYVARVMATISYNLNLALDIEKNEHPPSMHIDNNISCWHMAPRDVDERDIDDYFVDMEAVADFELVRDWHENVEGLEGCILHSNPAMTDPFAGQQLILLVKATQPAPEEGLRAKYLGISLNKPYSGSLRPDAPHPRTSLEGLKDIEKELQGHAVDDHRVRLASTWPSDFDPSSSSFKDVSHVWGLVCAQKNGSPMNVFYGGPSGNAISIIFDGEPRDTSSPIGDTGLHISCYSTQRPGDGRYNYYGGASVLSDADIRVGVTQGRWSVLRPKQASSLRKLVFGDVFDPALFEAAKPKAKPGREQVPTPWNVLWVAVARGVCSSLHAVCRSAFRNGVIMDFGAESGTHPFLHVSFSPRLLEWNFYELASGPFHREFLADFGHYIDHGRYQCFPPYDALTRTAVIPPAPSPREKLESLWQGNSTLTSACAWAMRVVQKNKETPVSREFDFTEFLSRTAKVPFPPFPFELSGMPMPTITNMRVVRHSSNMQEMLSFPSSPSENEGVDGMPDSVPGSGIGDRIFGSPRRLAIGVLNSLLSPAAQLRLDPRHLRALAAAYPGELVVDRRFHGFVPNDLTEEERDEVMESFLHDDLFTALESLLFVRPVDTINNDVDYASLEPDSSENADDGDGVLDEYVSRLVREILSKEPGAIADERLVTLVRGTWRMVYNSVAGASLGSLTKKELWAKVKRKFPVVSQDDDSGEDEADGKGKVEDVVYNAVKRILLHPAADALKKDQIVSLIIDALLIAHPSLPPDEWEKGLEVAHPMLSSALRDARDTRESHEDPSHGDNDASKGADASSPMYTRGLKDLLQRVLDGELPESHDSLQRAVESLNTSGFPMLEDLSEAQRAEVECLDGEQLRLLVRLIREI